MKDISTVRSDYKKQTLSKKDVLADPNQQFEKWFDEAIQAEVDHANAMTLSTVDSEGQPSGRIVLLKDYGEDGYTFFTNFESKKGSDLANNPRCSLTFFWTELERQVRIQGTVSKISDEESDEDEWGFSDDEEDLY